MTLVAAGAFSSSVCNGAPPSDGSASLQAQLDAIPPGGTLTLEPRTYTHSDVIRLSVPGVRIEGNGATIEATNEATSAVQITAEGVQLSNVTLKAPGGGKRWASVDQAKLAIMGAQDSVSDVTIDGAAAAGVAVDGANGFSVRNVSISDTRADGIHITGASRNGVVENVRTDRTGDDAVAVVSPVADGAPCADIRISDVSVASTRWGRGISVVGGRNVSIHGFSVSNTSAAGVYIATEGAPFFTDSVESVDVSGGTITGANLDAAVVQGAVLVYSGSSGKRVADARVSDVTISGTPPSAQRNVGLIVDEGSVSGISFSKITIDGSGTEPFFTNAPAGSYSASGLDRH